MGKSSDIVTGYEYYLDVQIAISQGPVDSITEFIYGERLAWEGEITGNESTYVNAPELFGGETREGGVQGTMTVTMGDSAVPDPHLVATIGPNVPAYIDMCTVIFKNFLWSKVNPYFKKPWFKYTRIFAGWDRGGTVWYPEKAQIGLYDMNPAHIIYQAITDRRWGMGYSPVDIDEPSFTAAADQLYEEGFGMSLEWTQAMKIEDFIRVIINTINGGWDLDLRTGFFRLRLVRDIVDVESLVELNPDNILEMTSFQRISWGEQANRVIVKYTDRNQTVQSVSVENLAAIEIEGGEIPAVKEYLGIRERSLALRVAARDLNTSSSPLAKVTLITNQVLWSHTIADVVALTWPKLGFDKIPFRILDITRTDLDDGSIRVDLIEDVFGLPSGVYVAQQPSLWVDPVQPPIPVEYARAMEAPYWDVIRRLSAADFATLTPGYGFGEVFAVRPTSDAFNFRVMSSPDNSAYTEVGAGDFCASATLAVGVSPNAETFELENISSLSQIDVGAYAYVDDEAFVVEEIDTELGVLSVGRGVLDTVPGRHLAGARIFFSGVDKGIDETEHVYGEEEYYKPLTHNGMGTSDSASATPLLVEFDNRAARPYPPGNMQINAEYYPEDLRGPLTVSWAHRNRLTQTADLIPYDVGDIGPEPGTTYVLRAVRVDTGAVLSTVETSATTADIDPGYTGEVEISVESIRDEWVSWQRARHSTDYLATGYGRAYGLAYGGVKVPGVVAPRPPEPYAVWSQGDAWAYIEALDGYLPDVRWIHGDVVGDNAVGNLRGSPGRAWEVALINFQTVALRTMRVMTDENYSSKPDVDAYVPAGSGWTRFFRDGSKFYFYYAPDSGSVEVDAPLRAQYYTDGSSGATPVLVFKPTPANGLNNFFGVFRMGAFDDWFFATSGGPGPSTLRTPKLYLIDATTYAVTTYDMSALVGADGVPPVIGGAHLAGGYIMRYLESTGGGFATTRYSFTADFISFTPCRQFTAGAWRPLLASGSLWGLHAGFNYSAGRWWYYTLYSDDGIDWYPISDLSGFTLYVESGNDDTMVFVRYGDSNATQFLTRDAYYFTSDGVTFTPVAQPVLPTPPPNAPDLPNAPALFPHLGRLIVSKHGWYLMYRKPVGPTDFLATGVAVYYAATISASPTWLPVE